MIKTSILTISRYAAIEAIKLNIQSLQKDQLTKMLSSIYDEDERYNFRINDVSKEIDDEYLRNLAINKLNDE